MSVNEGRFTLGHGLNSYVNPTMLISDTSHPNAKPFFAQFVHKLSLHEH